MAYLSAMIQVKLGRPLISFVVSQMRFVVGGMTKGYVRVTISFLAHCSRIARAQGVAGLVLRLKAYYVTLAQCIARAPKLPTTPRFSRGRGGLPSVIPLLHRERIMRQGDATVLRFWFTLFALYRVLEFPGVIKISTITKPGPSLDYFLPEWSDFVFNHFWPELTKNGWFRKDFSQLEFLRTLVVKPFLILRSAPSVNSLYLSTSPIGLIGAFNAWRHFPEVLSAVRDWLLLTKNTRFLNWFENMCNWSNTNFPDIGVESIGKLGLKDEAAGKVRVFAMTDPFTQWMMRPLHEFLFKILKKIPQDGTFDQVAPIRRLQELGYTNFWSFDLSAATDRLPLLLQAVLMSKLITSHGANLWMTILVGRPYSLPKRARDATGLDEVWYAVGQPMGARTSWAMLALTHHALVQYAAMQSGVTNGSWFGDYAVLGDDLVIANKRVASAYLKLMATIGVEISLAKSVVSERHQGVLEFAKKVFFRKTEVTPISLLELLAAVRSLPNWLELGKKYGVSLTQALMGIGYGWRSVSTLDRVWSRLPRRLQGYVSSWYGPSGPEFGGSVLNWLGSDSPTISRNIPHEAFLLDLARDVLVRVSAMIERARTLTKFVEVDRTRAHYGTSRYEQWQLPKFISAVIQCKTAEDWRRRVEKLTRGGALLVPVSEVADLTQDQIRGFMSLIEFVYRDAFFTLHSELRDIQTELEGLIENNDLLRLEAILDRLQYVEEALDSIGLKANFTARADVRKSTSYVRGGVWLRRWRRWQSFCKRNPDLTA